MNIVRQFIRRSSVLYEIVRVLFALGRLCDGNFRAIRDSGSGGLSEKSGDGSILLAGMVGLNADMLVQTALGVALKNSGRHIYQLSCDASLKLCFYAKSNQYNRASEYQKLVEFGQGAICRICKLKSGRYAKAGGFVHIWLSEFLTNADWVSFTQQKKAINTLDDVEALRAFTYSGLRLGEHAYSATVRFFASPAIGSEANGVLVLKGYLLSALVACLGVQRFLSSHPIEAVIVDHGIYVPQGVVTEVAKKRGIKVISFNTGYRKNTFLLARGDSYHYVIPRSRDFLHRTYSSEERTIAREYVESRVLGVSDWVHFQPRLASGLWSFQPSKVNVALFPNVLWDADIHFEEGIFNSSKEWLIDTANYFSRRLDTVLHIRIHPGEISGAVPSRLGVYELLQENGVLDFQNIRVYRADEVINSYYLASNCDYSIVFGSKIGIDLVALGHRVLTAGDCWTRGKGVTNDPISKESYYDYLDHPEKMTINRTRGLDFAYFIYFEAMYLFPFMKRRDGDPPFAFSSEEFLSELSDAGSDLNRSLNLIDTK